MKIVGRLVWKRGKQKRGGTDADKFRTYLYKPIPMSIFHSLTLLKNKIDMPNRMALTVWLSYPLVQASYKFFTSTPLPPYFLLRD